jgi:hypothetical protein
VINFIVTPGNREATTGRRVEEEACLRLYVGCSYLMYF